jgi:hypothetical protein
VDACAPLNDTQTIARTQFIAIAVIFDERNGILRISPGCQERYTCSYILDEALDTIESAPSNVDKLRRLLEERATKARRERLAQARANYDAAMAIRRARANRVRPPISEIRRRIKEVFTGHGEIASGVAFRNGEFHSDDDLLSLWDHLCELGVINQEDTGEQ